MIWDLNCHLSGISGRTPEERLAQLFGSGLSRMPEGQGATLTIEQMGDRLAFLPGEQ